MIQASRLARLSSLLALAVLQAGCGSTSDVASSKRGAPAAPCPIAGGVPADELIEPGEKHFAHLWKLTAGGENAEGYWSFAGDRIAFQRRNPEEGIDCDQIFITQPNGGFDRVSNGAGVTTCSYFLPGDRQVVFASTHASAQDCPPPVDFSKGYVWMVHPEHDLWVRDLASGQLESLTDLWGYDAEATISPLGDRMVFTSTRSGDLELWTCDLDGSDLFQVTDELGYDGGAFFSHDGTKLVFRSTAFDPENLDAEQATYRQLIADWMVRPHSMEIMVVDANGENRRQVTNLGRANFAPFFFPDDSRIIFSTNHHDPNERGGNFDLFAVGVDGAGLEAISTYEGFDSFAMFSPDGRYLAFSSNRGGSKPGETNLFIAEWRD